MKNELLIFIKIHTDMLREQTKTKLQEDLEFVTDKQMQTFSFIPSINLSDEGKWLLAVTFFECTNSAFNLTDENNSLPIIIPGHYQTESAGITIDELNKLLELRFLELHVKKERKRGNRKQRRR